MRKNLLGELYRARGESI